MTVLFSRRRGLTLLLASAAVFQLDRTVAQADQTKWSAFEKQLAATKNDELESARAYRELDYRVDGPTPSELQAQPGLGRRYKSDKSISGRARDMLIRFEVSGQQTYEARYRRPIWPKGQSGITIGIGYDVGYTSKELLAEDWKALLPDAGIKSLEGACGISGKEAGDLIAFVQDVDIPWTAATTQLERMTKFVAGETINAFPGAEKLSADSFGALLSLVYNRGGGMKSNVRDTLDRRREMRNIRLLIQQARYQEVAGEIRRMTRIWKNSSDARGLLERRELEAQLFEIGLEA